MNSIFRGRAQLVLAGAVCFAALVPNLMHAQQATPPVDSYTWNNRPPDPRFKADILLVVAHPDDEGGVSAYLAREIFDEHKRVAAVYLTPGDGGDNDVGPEQGASLGDIRKIEARRAMATLGVSNVWFLSGHDTYSQDPLASLEHGGHGRCLDELVRIVRITRPTVIITWMPGFTTGENHSDHQASGILATEAFDTAGDPTVFSEQVSPAINPDLSQQMTEGLRPWQPEKIYYFYNPTHDDIFTGRGPQYSAQDISPSQHVSYGFLAARELAQHQSQIGTGLQEKIDNHTLESSNSRFGKRPTRFILGKTLVAAGVTDDVFAGVVPEGIAFVHPTGYIAAPAPAEPTLVIGDPWRFYQRFWQAHDLKEMPVAPTEVTIHTGRVLTIPLVIENPLDHSIQVTLSTQAPDGWKLHPAAPSTVEGHSEYFVRVQADAPETKLPGWQQFSVSATADGKSLGSVPIRTELASGWVAPQ